MDESHEDRLDDLSSILRSHRWQERCPSQVRGKTESLQTGPGLGLFRLHKTDRKTENDKNSVSTHLLRHKGCLSLFEHFFFGGGGDDDRVSQSPGWLVAENDF